jgi:hypothetical protein
MQEAIICTRDLMSKRLDSKYAAEATRVVLRLLCVVELCWLDLLKDLCLQ